MGIESQISQEDKLDKLQVLAEVLGFADWEDMIGESVCDRFVPAICLHPDCNHTTVLEADAEQAYCEKCRRASVASALVIVGIA